MCTTILYGCTSIKKPGVLEDHPPEMLHNPCVFMLRAALGFIKIIFLTAIQEDLFVVIPHIFISHEKHISTNSIIRRFSLLFFPSAHEKIPFLASMQRRRLRTDSADFFVEMACFRRLSVS